MLNLEKIKKNQEYFENLKIEDKKIIIDFFNFLQKENTSFYIIKDMLSDVSIDVKKIEEQEKEKLEKIEKENHLKEEKRLEKLEKKLSNYSFDDIVKIPQYITKNDFYYIKSINKIVNPNGRISRENGKDKLIRFGDRSLKKDILIQKLKQEGLI